MRICLFAGVVMQRAFKEKSIFIFLLYLGYKDNLSCTVFTYITVVLYQVEIEQDSFPLSSLGLR